jgi:metal-dependent HD superfamily phosphatase/phosphodiesterase
MSKNILSIPIKNNKKLKTLMDFIDSDIELHTLWKCSNILAIDRMGYSDHGPVHVKIVANRAIKLLRTLLEKNIEPGIKVNYNLSSDDAELVILLASVTHDLGMSIIRDGHEVFSVQLARDIMHRCLPLIYGPEEATIIASEVSHAIISHQASVKPLTLEAGIVKVADALDMEQGRARIPYKSGRVNIHSVSALSIEKVSIEEGKEKPINIRIEMSNPAGIFQVDNLLATKIRDSGLEGYLSVEVIVGEKKERFTMDDIKLRLEG